MFTGDKRAFNRRLKEARIGDPAAQYEVALMYANGVGIAKDAKQAFDWTRSAAERGHVPAQYLLGCAYAGGQGVDKDELQAYKWLQKAASVGHAKASFRLAKMLATQGTSIAFAMALDAQEQGVAEAGCFAAECCATGMGTSTDTARARQLYAVAAEEGNAQAQYEMGRLCLLASSEHDDEVAARAWLRQAAGQGHPGACLLLNSLDEHRGGRTQQGPAKMRSGGKERRSNAGRWTKYVQQHGRAQDALDLGTMYAQGVGVEKSTRHARTWFRRAAELGSADGQYAVAQQLAATDPSEAMQWYYLAAEQGLVEAQLALAHGFAGTSGANSDPTAALYWLAKAAKAGHADAMVSLATTMMDASGSLAKGLLESAAILGQADAQFQLGERYFHGIGVAQNWFEATRWYQAAADQGHGAAQCMLAGCYSKGLGVRQDKAKAFRWYQQAAEHNLPQALWNLGEMYAIGVDGVAPDTKKAATLCKKAANAGFAPAQSTLGALFAKAGRFERAVHWWTLAADQGDLEAVFNLAQAFRTGNGVAQDVERGFALFLKAGEAGLRSAQSRLGLAYATGEGVAVDLLEACKWFELAAAKGDSAASANLGKARNLLSPSQYKEVLRRVAASSRNSA